MANCSNEDPTTDEFYEDISDDVTVIVFLALGSVLALLTLIIYAEEVHYIRSHYKPDDSRAWKILVLLGLYPTVCTLSLISLLVPTSSTLLSLIAACYLSFCIYIFIMMTIECYGGPEQMIETLRDDKIRLNTPPCCCCMCCILKPITMTRKHLRVLELMAMQVMFVRPLLLFIGAVLWTDGKYNTQIRANEPYTYITILSAISTLLSMYGLVVIFRASKLHLKHYHLTLKFVPLQCTIIFVNLQHSVFSILAERGIPECIGTRGPVVRGDNINKSLLVIEVFLMCLLARKGYRTKSPDNDERIEDNLSVDSSKTIQTVCENNGYGTTTTTQE